MAVRAFGLTDVGRKRRHNEDAYLVDRDRGLFVVADGMGGHAAGEVASRITVESIQEFIAGTEDQHESTWPYGFNNRYSFEGNRLTTAVEKANDRVMREVQNRPELKGMGTTVVASLFENGRATFVHVGDSRAYLLRNGELRRLTDDHSWVQEQVNAGILSPDEAKSHPLKNVVTRALGGGTHVSPDLIEVSLALHDRFLLCSDGLTGMITDDEILEYLSGEGSLDEKIVQKLIELANDRGGVDNITAIVIEVPESEVVSEPADDSAESRKRMATDVSLRAVKTGPVPVQPEEPKESPVPAVDAAKLEPEPEKAKEN